MGSVRVVIRTSDILHQFQTFGYVIRVFELMIVWDIKLYVSKYVHNLGWVFRYTPVPTRGEAMGVNPFLFSEEVFNLLRFFKKNFWIHPESPTPCLYQVYTLGLGRNPALSSTLIKDQSLNHHPIAQKTFSHLYPLPSKILDVISKWPRY